MTEEHKLGRIQATHAAINGKCTAYLDKKLQVKQSHNYTGAHLEKMVYDKETKTVTIYDANNKEIKETREVKAAPTKKVKTSSNVPNVTDEKPNRDIQR